MNEPQRATRVWFPYMRFARSEAMVAPFALTQSGMPSADPALFAELSGLDLGYAGNGVLPAFQADVARRYGVEPERVVVTPGATGAMNLVAAVLFRPGVRVAVETPSYEPLRALPRRAGAEVVEIDRRFERGWQIDPGEVQDALAGAREGHVSLTTPHNPSGARTEPGLLQELAEIAAGAGGVLISNEIYEEYVPPAQAVRAVTLAPNAISIGSLTKAYGLGALRLGWIVLGESLAARRPEFDDAAFLDFADPATHTLRAGRIAWQREAELRRPLEAVERDSKPTFRAWLESTPGVRALLPDHGVIAFVQLQGVHDTFAFQRFVHEREQVGVVPGEFFGRPGFLRLGFGGPPDKLRESLARLARGLAAYPRG